MTAHAVRWWNVGIAAVLLGGAEWLHTFSRPWDLVTAIAALCTAALLLPWDGWRRQALAALLVIFAAVAVATQHRLNRIENNWAEEREARVSLAGDRLAGDLHSAFDLTQRLADIGARAASLDRTAAFRVLAQVITSHGPETGIAILESDGTPWAWAGSHRLPPRASGDTIASASSQYYVTLESRRHSVRGRVAVANVLVWAHPAVPENSRSLAERFRARTDVELAVYAEGTAPDNSDVFDYCEASGEEERCLFSAQPLPPQQADARALEISRNGRAAAVLLLLVAVAAILVDPTPLRRSLLILLLFWLVLHAPVGSLLGAGTLFSAEGYFFQNLGPISRSAGTLGLAAVLFTMLAIWVWRQRLPRRWWGVPIGVAIFLAIPYGVSDLSRGITPPADGTSLGLWVTWFLALFLAGAGPIVLASALLRGDGTPRAGSWWPWAGALSAVVAAIVGLSSWQPGTGWPSWFLLLWVPAMLAVATPVVTSQAILAIGITAGSLAGLFTWHAELRGRMALAQRDVFQLGTTPDPVAPKLLERFAEHAREVNPPATPTGLYALWRSSILSEQGYPASLGVWNATEGWTAVLQLDSLSVPESSIMPLLVPGPPPDSVVPVEALPGMHYLRVTPFANGDLLVLIIGPRTQLVPPASLGRLLEPRDRGTRPYILSLSPPMQAVEPTPTMTWRREGWVVRSERTLSVAGTSRIVFVQTSLRGPAPLLVRGALLLILGICVLSLVWLVSDYSSGHVTRLASWRPLMRSFRVRLALTLALFFLLPAVGFAIWGLERVRRDAVRVGDALVSNTLREALQASGGFAMPDTMDAGPQLDSLVAEMDAQFALYRGGSLSATSEDLLSDLGLVGELMDPVAFTQLAYGGQVQATRDGPVPTLSERVGYRLVLPGTPSRLGVLATPRHIRETTATSQRDLAMVVILSLLLGLAAAVWSAQRAARALSRPVGDLRRAALALAEGRRSALDPASVPSEFEPVFGAFNRMEADIRASREALEAARRRTETVLATVSTGVVALDAEGRVLLANRRAEELLGITLGTGMVLRDHLGGAWEPLAARIDASLAGMEGDAVEYVTDGRRMTAQLANLAGPLGGVVVAVTDVTDLSRAERVLAWGEMARQVAHEIKNPLTPMRLGMQHLRRAWQDKRGDYEKVLTETSERMLAEIDRLDTVARAFSRFGVPGAGPEEAGNIDIVAVTREVVQLYALSDEGTRVELEAPMPVQGRARKDELKEVLMNLLENARAAGAQRIGIAVRSGEITVRDDGRGIPAEQLPRVFEPHFSTTTSGSGLGLSIVKRLVESWGGKVSIASDPGKGTTVTVTIG